MSSSHSEEQQSRDRLLRAAGALFAEHGFRGVTVREICQRAGVNVSAVSYYFAGKQELYEAVLSQFCCVVAREESALSAPGENAAERLRGFVRAFMLGLLDREQAAWQGKLMAREMTEPTEAFERLVEQSIRPRHEQLVGIVRDLLGEVAVDDATLRRCAFSIISQCLFYFHGQHVVQRLVPHWSWERDGIETLAAHVSQFSLAAINAIASGSPVSNDEKTPAGRMQ